MSTKMGGSHVRDLDALRGIAIFGVLLTHVTSSLGLMGMYPPLVHLDLTQFFVTGGLGVQLFFLLSGFLLTTTESRRYAAGAGSVPAYARRRFLRLAPAYYLSLLVLLAVQLLQGGYHPTIDPGVDLLVYLTFLHTVLPGTGSDINPAYWSLACEVTFYALLPLLIRWAPRLRTRLALYALSLALSALLYLVYGSTRDVSLQFAILFNPATSLHLFLAGSLLSSVGRAPAEGGRARRRAACGDFLLLAALAGITLNAYVVSATPAAIVVSRLGTSTLVAVGFAAYVLGSPLLGRVLALPGLAYLGRISFSIYLFHGLAANAAERLGWVDTMRAWGAHGAPHLALFVLYLGGTLAFSIAVGSVSYRWVEMPGMRGIRFARAALVPASAG